MSCPRCRSFLVVGEYENEAAKYCEACGGILIKQRSLQKVLSRLSQDIYSSVDMNAALPPLSDLGAVGTCPECSAAMDHYGYMESNKVMIDCCESCNALWVDPLEFMAMSKMYVKTNKYRDYQRANEHRGADLVGAQAFTEAFSKAFLLGFISRSIF